MAARTVLLNLIGNDRASRMFSGLRRRVDETSGSLDRLNRVGGGAMSGVTKRLGSMVKVAAKFATIGIGAAFAISQAVQLATALAPLAGLLAGIPAGIALAGAALVTFKLALSGVGDAFKAAMGDDAKAFEESLKGLTPAARAVARELRSLRPALLGIRNAAQSAFFGPLQGQLKATAGVLAGPLRSGVRGVAAEYGRAAVQGLKFAREGKTASGLTVIFGGVRRAVASIRPAITPVLRGFRDMAVQGTGTLSKLAGGVGNLGVRFGQWMQKFAASGGVQAALGGAFALIKQIGGVLGDLGGIIASFARAASSGGGLFAFLGTLTSQLNAFLKTAAAQNALRVFFTGVNALAAALAPLVPILASVVGKYLAALGPIFIAMSPLVGAFVSAIGQFLNALTPILPALSQFATTMHAQLQPILIPIIGLIGRTAAQIGGALVEALIACMPSILQLATSVATLLPVWAQLTPLFASLVIAILPLVPQLLRLATILVTALVPVLRIAILILVKWWSTIIGFVIPVIKLLVTVVTWLANVIKPVFLAIWTGIQAVGKAAMWLWTTAVAPAFRFIGTLAKWLFSIVAVLVLAPLLIAFKLVSAVVMALWTHAFRPAFTFIGNLVKAVYNTAIRPVLNAIVTVLRTVVAPVVRWFYNSVIKPVWNAVGSAIRTVWTRWIKPTFDLIKSAVGKLSPAFRNAVDAIKTVWDKLKDAAKKPVSFVVNSVFNGGIVKLWNAVANLVPGVSKLSPIKGFARGGVYPGYTPGRDIGLAAVSGGEAIMRPEFTRAVGADFIESANAMARRGGVTGVAKFLGGVGDPSGVPGFAGRFFLGGIVGKFAKAAKGFFAGGLVKTARKAFGPMLDGSDRALGGMGGFGRLIAGIPRALVSKILAFFGPLEEKIGGPGKRAVRAARSQIGVPYSWGGGGLNGPSRGIGRGANTVGFDCSALMRYAWYQAAKKAMPRTTYGQIPWVRKISKPVPGALGFPHSGHVFMASDKANRIIEAPFTGARVREVGMRSANWGLPPWKFDQGGMLEPGFTLAYNATRSPEPVLTGAQFDALTGSAGGGAREVHLHLDHVTIRETVDIDRLMQQIEFRLRAASL
ncbi:NlpC/P60 family protein [Actinomadura sp. 9N215]|uniref:NlpC/P60 family protein n=1 Tax=Actinomadura sp. 9N215 TaxID=3375150 RepID=UPI0037BA2128